MLEYQPRSKPLLIPVAVWGFARAHVVVLMKLFRPPESGHRQHTGYNIQSLIFQQCDQLFADAPLFVIMHENGRSILGTDIRALTVLLGRIVNFKEQFRQGFKIDLCRVIEHFDGFQMTGLLAAYLFITGVIHMSTHVAGDYGYHAGLLLQQMLDAPETAAGKVGGLQCTALLFGQFLGTDKVHGDGVDAMTYILARQHLALEHMAQMSAAVGAEDFGTAAIRIDLAANGTFDFIIEAGPAAVGGKFVLGAVQRRATLLANIHPGLEVFVVAAGKGALGPLVEDDVLFFRGQLFVTHHGTLAFDWWMARLLCSQSRDNSCCCTCSSQLRISSLAPAIRVSKAV